MTKLTLNLPDDLIERIRKEAESRQLSMTETIRRSLETELFLTEEEKSGAKILLEKKNHTRELVRGY